MSSTTRSSAPPALVAIAAWIIPGTGYFLVGETARGLLTGITIIALYLGGLLIGGVRVIEVPGYDTDGQAMQVKVGDTGNTVSIMRVAPMDEIKAKPWAIAQILAGPMGIASGLASVNAARPSGTMMHAAADITHTPVNEAGTLYTAVAGMLNLLAIIDAAHRATYAEAE